MSPGNAVLPTHVKSRRKFIDHSPGYGGSELSTQTVFIVDDDEAVRDSIKELVESAGMAAKTFDGALSFLSACTGDVPGCLVLDVRMARMSGLALQQRLREGNSTMPIVFISGHGDVDTAVTAIKAGAVDFVQKPYQDQSLLDAINNALELDATNRCCADEVTSIRKSIERLTTREKEVLKLLLEGLTNKAIARQLDISPRTVEVHRRNLLRKFDASSVTELANMLVHLPGGQVDL